jgi:hypothetical protein
MVICFVRNDFSDNTRVRIFFFPEFNIRLYVKSSESDYFFFLLQNQNLFFSNIGNLNIFFRKKTIHSDSIPCNLYNEGFLK